MRSAIERQIDFKTWSLPGAFIVTENENGYYREYKAFGRLQTVQKYPKKPFSFQ